jgi:hypothetical protein
MTDFKNFYAKTLKNFPSSLNDFEAEMQRAYEAGAASQAGTLRDEFAGKAMQGIVASYSGGHETAISKWSYKMADAMLEARKTPEGGE